MRALTEFAEEGGPVIGSCNGFQVLCESGLLPGALMRNASLEFRCQPQHLRVERAAAPFTSLVREGDVLAIPVSHGDGNYYADAETLERMEANGQIAFRYCDAAGDVTPEANPNGSLDNIAGVTNEAGNVLGLMPHPGAGCGRGAGRHGRPPHPAVDRRGAPRAGPERKRIDGPRDPARHRGHTRMGSR